MPRPAHTQEELETVCARARRPGRRAGTARRPRPAPGPGRRAGTARARSQAGPARRHRVRARSQAGPALRHRRAARACPRAGPDLRAGRDPRRIRTGRPPPARGVSAPARPARDSAARSETQSTPSESAARPERANARWSARASAPGTRAPSRTPEQTRPACHCRRKCLRRCRKQTAGRSDGGGGAVAEADDATPPPRRRRRRRKGWGVGLMGEATSSARRARRASCGLKIKSLVRSRADVCSRVRRRAGPGRAGRWCRCGGPGRAAAGAPPLPRPPLRRLGGVGGGGG